MAITQTQRNLQISTPFGLDAVVVASMKVEEGMSSLFSIEVELLSEDHELDFAAIVGEPATVSLRTADGQRHFSGIVRRFRQEETDLDLARYRAELVPWLWLLSRTVDCRIYQDLTVPEILEKLFGELGFGDAYEMQLSDTYEPRVFCVQYRESDLNFVMRLMEDEGMHFYFRHEAKRHVLVLGDSPSANPSCPGQAQARFNRDRRSVQSDDFVSSLFQEQVVRSTKVRLTDYNFETPTEDLAAERASEGDARWEIYDYPGKYAQRGLGTRYARIRLEEEAAPQTVLTGFSLCRAFTPGYRFTLKEHPRADINTVYLLTRIVHMANEAAGIQPGRAASDAFSYENRFEAIPHAVPFRPQRLTPRPIIRGSQTAVVVGPPGEEIYTDQFGQVKVQFHWDREGQRDDKSSCWIRVSHAWAGKNWGAIYIPRIGQEVIVDFLEGDPDRPIITGRVYHAESMPPYELPGDMTKSALQSRSSKGGSPGNFNELRFEDKLGSEEVYVQAEKDRNVLVKHDNGETIGNDETISVGHDRKKDVTNNETTSIGVDRTETVGNNETIAIGLDRTETVGSNETITIGVDRAETVGGNETIAIGSNRTETVGANETITVGMNRALTVAIAYAETVGAAKALSVGAAYQVSVGGVMNETVGGAKMEEVGAYRMEAVEGDKTVTVGGDFAHTTSGKHEESGEDVTITGKTKITLQCGASQIVLEPALITIKAPLVKINC